MGYKLVCDHCGTEITAEHENIRVEGQIKKNENLQKVWKYYHVDCFNYKFSTDIRKLLEV